MQIKFQSKQDAQLFLVEIGKFDLLKTIDDQYVPTDEMVELFIKSRRSIVPTIKNFRRSQASKEAWRSNRYKYMRGIRKFHGSTEGKQFHRSMGRFLATREFLNKYSRKRESLLNCGSIHETCDILKALSSLRTHVYIQYQYYMPSDDQAEFEIFSEDLLKSSMRLEMFLSGDGDKIFEEDLDIVLRSICLDNICEVISKDKFDVVKKAFTSHIEEAKLSYVEIINSIYDKIDIL